MSSTFAPVVRFYLLLDGASQSDEALMATVEEIHIESTLHAPDLATIRIHDMKGAYDEDARFLPGTSLKLDIDAAGQKGTVFEGEIVELETEYGVGSPRYVLRAFDRLHRLSHGRKARSFVDVTDSDVVKKMAQEAGLGTDVEDTSHIHSYLLQANESDLSFLLRRAHLLGYLLYVRGTTLTFKPPPAPENPIEVEWKETLTDFRPRISALGQFQKITVRGWDMMNREEIAEDIDTVELTAQIGESRTGGDLVKDAYGRDTERLVSDEPIADAGFAKAVGQAVANRHAGDYIEAEGVIAGGVNALAGAWIKVKGVGSRFEGNYLLTDVSHDYTVGIGYQTRFHVAGYRGSSLLALLPPPQKAYQLTGLRIGIVTDNNDPDQLGRVKVKFPWLTSDHTSDWARVVSAGAGASRGLQFIPEIDDEVVLGFDFGDIHHPFVLGGLWNGKDALPDASVITGGKVEQRMIQSRAGHIIRLDDRDSDGGITIVDKNGNTLQVSSKDDSFTITIGDKIVIKGGGNVEIEAGGDMALKSSGSLSIKSTGAMNLESSASLSVKASAAMNLEASATVAVKGTGATFDANGAVATISGSIIKLN